MSVWWPTILNSGVEFPSFYWILCFHLVVSLLGGAGAQRLDALLCCSQVSRKVPHLHCTVQTARRYKRGFHPEQTHGGTFICLSGGLGLRVLKTRCDTWSRRCSPQHWCGWSPGPHSAHAHCPSATHKLTCPTDKWHIPVLYWPIYRIRVDMWSWNWITHVPVLIVSLFSGIVSALCLQRCDCVNMTAHLCTACKKKAFPENIQWEDGICERRADKSSGECVGWYGSRVSTQFCNRACLLC